MLELLGPYEKGVQDCRLHSTSTVYSILFVGCITGTTAERSTELNIRLYRGVILFMDPSRSFTMPG